MFFHADICFGILVTIKDDLPIYLNVAVFRLYELKENEGNIKAFF